MKRVLCGLIVGFALTACNSSGPVDRDHPKIILYTDWYPQAEHGGYYAAMLNGYWKELGLDVEIIPAGPSGGLNPNLKIGQKVALQPNSVGMMRGDDLILNVSRGLPLIAVNSHLQHDALCLLVHAGSPVKNFADLEGHEIACTPGIVYMDSLVHEYHYKNLRARAIPGGIENFAADPSFIQEGYATDEPFALGQLGISFRILMISQSGFDPYRCLAANTRCVREHPDWLRKFSLGAYRGWESYLKDPALANAYMVKANPDATPDSIAFAYRSLKELHLVEGDPAQGEGLGTMQESRWQTTVNQLTSLHLLDAPVPLADIYTDAFTPDHVGFKKSPDP